MASEQHETNANSRQSAAAELVPTQKETSETQTGVKTNGETANEEYSVFTVPQKRALVLSVSLLGWFSPMTGSIYYPALNQV